MREQELRSGHLPGPHRPRPHREQQRADRGQAPRRPHGRLIPPGQPSQLTRLFRGRTNLILSNKTFQFNQGLKLATFQFNQDLKLAWQIRSKHYKSMYPLLKDYDKSLKSKYLTQTYKKKTYHASWTLNLYKFGFNVLIWAFSPRLLKQKNYFDDFQEKFHEFLPLVEPLVVYIKGFARYGWPVLDLIVWKTNT